MPGRIRNGKSAHGKTTTYPHIDGFTQVISLTPEGSRYGNLSPYSLRNETGELLENVWQFSKVYPRVPGGPVRYAARSKKIVWDWPAQVHLDLEGNPTAEYWQWRKAGKRAPEPVRTPVGWKNMKTCKYALEKDEQPSETNPKLDYIESRKKIYLPIYYRSVIQHPDFLDLSRRWRSGENLLIIEIDGPHQESMPYYQEKYNVPNDFIVDNTIESTENNLAILLNDPKHPFGHGYCLAWALQTYLP